jgi:hypothetical protein
MTFYNLLLLFVSNNIASSSLVFIINIKAKNDSSSLLLFNRKTSRLRRLLFTFIPIFIKNNIAAAFAISNSLLYRVLIIIC